MKMISRRLTKVQKDEIVEAYRAGENTNTIAEKYGCSPNTIIRTAKTLLSDVEYKLLKEQRLKNSNKKSDQGNFDSLNVARKDLDNKNSFSTFPVNINDDEQYIKSGNDFYNSEFREIPLLPISDLSDDDLQNIETSNMDKTKKQPDDAFEEIVPIVSSSDSEKKELEFELLTQEVLPESVYMLVDKKVELEIETISDLPEWSFLPENELKRNAIILFSNQRNAKRNCSRNQRVIKIPNTSVFEVSKSYLFSKGITRLILEDSIIALDS